MHKVPVEMDNEKSLNRLFFDGFISKKQSSQNYTFIIYLFVLHELTEKVFLEYNSYDETADYSK